MAIRSLKGWATYLNGRQYPLCLTSFEQDELKEDGVVVVYGSSDDLCEFAGAIYDETGAGDGYEIFVTTSGRVGVLGWDEEEPNGYHRIINVIQGDDIYWSYETDIPHETFYILEDNGINCKAILFYLHDCGMPKKYTHYRNGNAWEVWDVERANDKFPFIRVGRQGDFDKLHEETAELIAAVLNCKQHNNSGFLRVLKEIGLD